jgi:flagellar motor protein MotB
MLLVMGLLLVSLLAGCSTVPDEANPVEWYRSTGEWISGEDAPKEDTDAAAKIEERPIEKGAPYPNLASVPQRPGVKAAPGAEQSLDRDRQQAQSQDAAIRAGRLPPTTPVATGAPAKSSAPAPATSTRKKADRDQLAAASPKGAAAERASAGGADTIWDPSFSFEVGTIYFKSGSSHLSRRGRADLKRIAKLYKQQPSRLRVIGHASGRTRDMPIARHKIVNYRVSIDRATTVARILRRLGVANDDMLVTAKSDWDPIYYEIMPEGEAMNRRVVVYLEY